MFRHQETVRTAKSGADVVTVEEAKAYIRGLPTAAEDPYIQTLIASAQEVAEENYLSLRTAEFQTTYVNDDYLRRYPGNAFRLPMYPARMIVEVQAQGYAPTDQLEVVDPERYRFMPEEYALHFSKLWNHRIVTIRYKAGFDRTRPMPAQAKIGVLSYIGAMYEVRDGWATPPMTFLDALDSYRSHYISDAGAYHVDGLSY